MVQSYFTGLKFREDCHCVIVCNVHSPPTNIPDTVEDIDQDEEQSDEQGHAARHHLGLDEEGDPGDDHKHAARQVNLHQILHSFSYQPDLESTGCIRS